tara:strand:- start:586 stop:777 length:192 start_codon:yes stop_codon:yes gene_type:complete
VVSFNKKTTDIAFQTRLESNVSIKTIIKRLSGRFSLRVSHLDSVYPMKLTFAWLISNSFATHD